MSSEQHDFQGVNAAYIEELYERFLRDPHSVDASARALFQTWSPAYAEGFGEAGSESSNLGEPQGTPRNLQEPRAVVGAVNLAQSIRRYGHLAAQIDPLGSRPLGDPALDARDARRHRSRSARAAGDPDRAVRSPTARRRCGTSSSGCARSTARRPATTSRTSSCPRSGAGCARPIETGRFRAPADPIDPVALLDRLTRGRGVRAVPAPHVPRQDAVLDRGARHARADPRRSDQRGGRGRHAAGVHRHGASRPAERDGARARQAVRADSGGVQGSGPARARDRRRAVERRREVPPRRVARDRGRRRGRPRRLDAAESEPSRGDRSGARRHGARGRHRREPAAARRCSIPTPCCRS